MIVGTRIKARLESLGMSQAELARRVGLSQPAINGLIRGAARSSPRLHRIAYELGTTPAFLTGEIDDPDANAPPPSPSPAVQLFMMPVALPNDEALTRMFEGLLEAFPDLRGAALARELATLLPTALGAVRGPLFQPRLDHDDVEQSRPDTADAIRPVRRRA